ncbi:uncharacterized protein E0L32_003658 [Thyridium curvatum]|uniref:Vezatin n=1 Tax=Thyridium curvatum TaxID=1093900 RepID=A0A507BA42_9PEZI|nr:uncharacterized protein E0L32_003658 [Thyridium curvatum]TPX16717.1 hypothetical protein E0L32_003658 [Thyridium curvatum]
MVSPILTRGLVTDEGEVDQKDWAQAEPQRDVHTPPPSPPSPSFAPVGRPLVKKRFRNQIPNPLKLDVPRSTSLSSSLHNSYSRAVVSRIDRADNSKFIEQFRYTIIASQLLTGHSALGVQHRPSTQDGSAKAGEHDALAPTTAGLMVAAAAAVALAWVISWVYMGGYSYLTKKRVFVVLGLLVAVSVLGHAYIRQQWLRYIRSQALNEVTNFVTRSQDFDSATSAAVGLIQEVELVSRGYRLSTPLPPVSRIDDRSQSRRCNRLRKVVKKSFSDLVQKYTHTSTVVKSFSEQLDLEKYYDIYDISDFDMSDAMQGFSDSEFEDPESLRTLKVVAARFHTLRKMFLCAILALEAHGDNSDFLRWTTAVEALRSLSTVTGENYERIRTILSEEETFPSVPTPKMPLSPGRERWRSSLRKLDSLSTGIRGLQAKLVLLREESSKTLNEADDVSELGPNLMAQYDSIGQDLKILTQAWEEGKAALASGIDRNEKRLSSISSVLSPSTSLSGITTVDEGGVSDALKALNGGSPSSSAMSSPTPEVEEVFEAIAMPSRPKTMLSREERLVRMREDREKRAEVRERSEANKGMLRELEMVINLRPKPPTRVNNAPASGRVSL